MVLVREEGEPQHHQSPDHRGLENCSTTKGGNRRSRRVVVFYEDRQVDRVRRRVRCPTAVRSVTRARDFRRSDVRRIGQGTNPVPCESSGTQIRRSQNRTVTEVLGGPRNSTPASSPSCRTSMPMASNLAADTRADDDHRTYGHDHRTPCRLHARPIGRAEAHDDWHSSSAMHWQLEDPSRLLGSVWPTHRDGNRGTSNELSRFRSVWTAKRNSGTMAKLMLLRCPSALRSNRYIPNGSGGGSRDRLPRRPRNSPSRVTPGPVRTKRTSRRAASIQNLGHEEETGRRPIQRSEIFGPRTSTRRGSRAAPKGQSRTSSSSSIGTVTTSAGVVAS